ncbi:hypothetical protein [Clostridium oryzae]|uniref:Membrane protein NfeD2 N-terminal transmembrane domain-containing protein n=1 Tax=Clostridium oryzae TaxID=1450648 RepID=A0A1V4ILX8_9CLOT|nr:hypothetical protein [Clostridium oryzae]OPJ60487.1 hypothetical protein CLORY_27960 [Clostridium oryzae]
MEYVYVTIFFVGVIYTAATFILGNLFDFLNLSGEVLNFLHLDTHVNIDINGVDNSNGAMTISPFKPLVIVSFLTVFGGVGMIGTHAKLNPIITFFLAFILAYLIAAILYKFILIPLYRAQNTSSVMQKEIIGMRAVVLSPILEESFGQISYVINGSRQNAPAKSIDGKSVSQGQDVIIREIKDGIFYVEALKNNNLSIKEKN